MNHANYIGLFRLKKEMPYEIHPFFLENTLLVSVNSIYDEIPANLNTFGIVLLKKSIPVICLCN